MRSPIKNHLVFPGNLDDNRLGEIPDAPTVTITGTTNAYQPKVIIDNPFENNTEVTVTVAFYYSTDQGLNYQKVELIYIIPLPPNDPYYGLDDDELNSQFNPDTSFYFADVTYDFGEDSNNIKNYYNTFYLSSQPMVLTTPSIQPRHQFMECFEC